MGGEYLPAMSPSLARIIFWAAALCCAVAQGLLINSVLTGAAGDYPGDRRKHPRRGGMRWGPDRRAETTASGPSSTREFEIGWALLPAIGLAALLIATWRALPD